MEWSEERIARLRALWAEGLTTAEIGRRLGVSKNAVCGKAARIGCEPRSPPIRPLPSGFVRQPVVRRMRGPTLPPIAPAVPVPCAAAPPRAGRFPCAWPLGKVGGRHRFCDAPTSYGSSYCPEHHALAHRPMSRSERRLEDLAL